MQLSKRNNFKQMLESKKPIICGLAAAVLCFLVPTSRALSQSAQNPKPAEDDVVRVQNDWCKPTSWSLTRRVVSSTASSNPDFELRVDGKTQPVQFFEKITAGSADEEAQLSAARGQVNRKGKETTGSIPLDRGRTVIFYVDDPHIPPRDVNSIRKLLLNFIDKQMGQNDVVAIHSVTGQIGFLQQLSDNRAVLHAAVDRLKANSRSVTDMDRPPMTEYQALLIDRYDRDLTDVFVEQMMRDFPGLTRAQAETMLQGRAHSDSGPCWNLSTSTLSGLIVWCGPVRGCRAESGLLCLKRFLCRRQKLGQLIALRRITGAAARNGVVIYSVDARPGRQRCRYLEPCDF